MPISSSGLFRCFKYRYDCSFYRNLSYQSIKYQTRLHEYSARCRGGFATPIARRIGIPSRLCTHIMGHPAFLYSDRGWANLTGIGSSLATTAATAGEHCCFISFHGCHCGSNCQATCAQAFAAKLALSSEQRNNNQCQSISKQCLGNAIVPSVSGNPRHTDIKCQQVHEAGLAVTHAVSARRNVTSSILLVGTANLENVNVMATIFLHRTGCTERGDGKKS